MRGKVILRLRTPTRTGITPAYAGKRAAAVHPDSAPRDHPRVCGEKTLMRLVRFAVLGSPPRMRGKDADAERGCERGGITPAYAGKRKRNRQSNRRNRDHPRVCGEKFSSFSDSSAVKGSPPRMRGKANSYDYLALNKGITPAYAGKSSPKRSKNHETRDHPRVCGEKYCCTAMASRRSGSPPRMRGKGALDSRNRQVPGITPAYAGKRKSAFSYLSRFWDHPRVCGEKTKKIP